MRNWRSKYQKESRNNNVGSYYNSPLQSKNSPKKYSRKDPNVSKVNFGTSKVELSQEKISKFYARTTCLLHHSQQIGNKSFQNSSYDFKRNERKPRGSGNEPKESYRRDYTYGDRKVSPKKEVTTTPVRSKTPNRYDNSYKRPVYQSKQKYNNRSDRDENLIGTDISYTKYHGGVLCRRGSNYTKKLEENLKDENSQQKLDNRYSRVRSRINNRRGNNNYPKMKFSGVKQNFRNSAIEFGSVSKYDEYSSKIKMAKSGVYQESIDIALKKTEDTDKPETARYTPRNQFPGPAKEPSSFTSRSQKEKLGLAKQKLESNLPSSRFDNGLASDNGNAVDFNETKTSPFSFNETNSNTARTVNRNQMRKSKYQDYKRLNEEKTVADKGSGSKYPKVNRYRQREDEDESLNKGDMGRFGMKLKYLEEKLHGIEVGRIGRKNRKRPPTASTGEQVIQNSHYSMIKSKIIDYPGSKLAESCNEFSNLKERYKRDHPSRPNHVESSRDVVNKSPFRERNPNTYSSSLNSSNIKRSVTPSRYNFQRKERPRIPVDRKPPTASHDKNSPSYRENNQNPPNVFKSQVITGKKSEEKKFQSAQKNSRTENMGFYSQRRKSKYSNEGKKSAEMQRIKDVEKYVQAANRSHVQNKRSYTPSRTRSSKYSHGTPRVGNRTEYKPKKDNGNMVQRAHRTSSKLKKGEHKEVEGQVSYLERIACSHYLKKKVSYLSQFGQFLGDCKEQMILSRRCQQYLRSRPFKGDTVRLKDNSRKRKTILLDLDETLIHSEEYQKGAKYDLEVVVETKERKDKIGVFMRPYCMQFLRRLSEHFELVIFTASREDYANLVIDLLDPEGTMIAKRLYRQHCINFESLFIKDLRIMENRSKRDMIIVDNLIYSYANDIENGIPIKGYYEGKEDYELKYLCEKLLNLKKFMDCPTFIENNFNLAKFYNYI